jgi:plasmid maintenance system antidote protein VapI
MIEPKPFEPDYAVHPGATLLECILFHFAYEMQTGYTYSNECSERERDNAQNFAAKLLTVILEEAPITEDIITRLPRSFPPKKFWLNYQANYEKTLARLKAEVNGTPIPNEEIKDEDEDE